jgi:serine protease AprX
VADASDQRVPDPRQPSFDPQVLDKTVIAIPLLNKLDDEKKALERGEPAKVFSVVIDLNLEFEGGRDAARDRAIELVKKALQSKGSNPEQRIDLEKSRLSQQYLFGRLEGEVIRELVRLDNEREPAEEKESASRIAYRSIYHIWPDFELHRLTTRSISTVKADAARTSFSAFGEGIVWAVLDSGIDKDHPHFAKHQNLLLEGGLRHEDFTGKDDPLTDPFGHGTHVAGIISGEAVSTDDQPIRAVARHRNEHGEITYDRLAIPQISGMAPKCKLVSMRVLDEKGSGEASNLIAAIERIQEINGYGRRLLVHGVNLSVGYDFEPEWFACGQSPLCVEVDRLVRSGVVVVVAAGNTGYGWGQTLARGAVAAGLPMTINDPGNAELAITVGSTHRDMPHVYGVSYFSSKGPTGDGRLKPDLLAPGEKILSCAAGRKLEDAKQKAGDCGYAEDSGTSMAAPHVSGVIAAFLSVRREFIGRPERVKEIFLSTATDLNREVAFQGRGLVDLMRAIQSV